MVNKHLVKSTRKRQKTTNFKTNQQSKRATRNSGQTTVACLQQTNNKQQTNNIFQVLWEGGVVLRHLPAEANQSDSHPAYQ